MARAGGRGLIQENGGELKRGVSACSVDRACDAMEGAEVQRDRGKGSCEWTGD